MPGSIAIYTEDEIITFNRDVKPSVSVGNAWTLRFATKEIKGVIFPLEQMIWKFNLKKDVKNKRLVNSVKYHYYP